MIKIHLKSINSTNEYAKIIAQKEKKQVLSAGGVIVTADEQTSGKGRCGRKWISEQGNLYTSLLIPINNIDKEKLGQVSFIASLAVLNSVKKCDDKANMELKLKWPNDVLFASAKFCGILLEIEDDFLIIGIGVNITKIPDNDKISYKTTSLAKQNIIINKDVFADILWQEFIALFNSWNQYGFLSIKKDWLLNAKGLNEPIKINLGKEKFIRNL
jgi:BirA family biotin operon repressor/biotin-[acetyl-CoA-carboxylase] ligase